MSTNVLVIYTLTLTLAITVFYGRLRQHFSPVHVLQARVERLNDHIREERFLRLLTSYQFADFKTEVATILPEAIRKKGPGEKSFQMRMLASVVEQHNNDVIGFEAAHMMFQKGSRYFDKGNYDGAIETFQALIRNHPYSTDVPKAMFLIVEASFRTKQYDQMIDYTDQMLDLYPDNELTGYAMLRLGRVYEFKQRHQDAVDIYKTIIKSFPNPALTSLAENSLRQEQL